MKNLDLTLPSPAQNLACDEALLDQGDAAPVEAILRFWEPSEYFVVLGYANHARAELNWETWKAAPIPILRRCTGGGTVLQGPGCLNYTLILPIDEAGPLHSITATNAFIMGAHRQALEPILGSAVSVQGITDLALGALKFSGNAQRRKRRCLLFHGTFLLAFDLPQIASRLAAPAQQPAYRHNRSHQDFLTNLNVPAERIKTALRRHWQAQDQRVEVPFDQIDQLVQQKYARDDWNLKF